jgi:hypothetical protein
MSSTLVSILISGLTIVAVQVQGQGTFRNLDFELAQVPTSTPAGTLVPTGSAVPFWTAYLGNDQQSTVQYNQLYLGSGSVDLLTSDGPYSMSVFQGRYGVALQAGGPFGGGGGGDASISQTGAIPQNALTLLFAASAPYGAGWTVSVGGQVLPVVQLQQINANSFIYGADIAAFVGKTEDLKFTALLGTGSPLVNMFLDGIQFSPNSIPEPSVFAVAALGGILIGIFRRRRPPELNYGD